MTRIALLAGSVRARGREGHHDYRAGCRLLRDLLNRVDGVEASVFDHGWPDDAKALENTDAVVVYDGGNGKQRFLREPARLAAMEALIDGATGLTLIHQAVAFPPALHELAQRWLGGAYVPGASQRGHWNSRHACFPMHAVTRGVQPWAGRDGWLRALRFDAERERLTPLLWSGKRYRGDPEGGTPDIVAWLYERDDGGRSFAYTGIDAHRAWRRDGLRRLVANGVLWTAGHELPADDDYDWTFMSEDTVDIFTTPRRASLRHALTKIGRLKRARARW